MTEPEAVKAALSPQQLEQLWAEHLKGEFETQDVEAPSATMVEDAYVNHMPVNTGGRGKRVAGLLPGRLHSFMARRFTDDARESRRRGGAIRG